MYFLLKNGGIPAIVMLGQPKSTLPPSITEAEKWAYLNIVVTLSNLTSSSTSMILAEGVSDL